MAMSEFQYTLLVVRRQAALVEKGATFLLAQIAQRNDSYEILPTNIPLPGRVWSIATCQHRQNCIGKLRQKGCAQPAIERSENLVCVDENHGSLRRGIQ